MAKKSKTLLEDAVVALQGAVEEVVPPEAQTHLMAAQRELILALAITIDYHASRKTRKRSPSGAKKGARKASKRSPAASKPKRIRLD